MKRNTFFIVFNGLSVAKNDETSAHYSRIFIQKYDHFVSFWYRGIFINNVLVSPENQINLMIDDNEIFTNKLDHLRYRNNPLGCKSAENWFKLFNSLV